MHSALMKKRIGDSVKISGDYQYRALIEGNSVQRFWHYSKQLAIKKYLPPSSHDKVIDVGCGSGVITSLLGSYGADVLGIDGNSDAITFAAEKFSSPNIRFRLGLIDEKIKINTLVDKIYCLEVIEHIYMHQAYNMLKVFYLDI